VTTTATLEAEQIESQPSVALSTQHLQRSDSSAKLFNLSSTNCIKLFKARRVRDEIKALYDSLAFIFIYLFCHMGNFLNCWIDRGDFWHDGQGWCCVQVCFVLISFISLTCTIGTDMDADLWRITTAYSSPSENSLTPKKFWLR